MRRTLRLARIAAEAEGLRLQRMARRTAIRLTIGLLALVFLGCALAALQVGVWFLLRVDLGWQPQTAGLSMAGFDFAAGVVLLAIAAGLSPGRAEREALDVRRRAWESAIDSLAMSAMLLSVLRLLTAGLLRRRPGK
jgi:hypothetical protein